MLKEGQRILCCINPYFGDPSEIFEIYGEVGESVVTFFNRDRSDGFTVEKSQIEEDFEYIILPPEQLSLL